jgi:hypothetical protein
MGRCPIFAAVAGFFSELLMSLADAEPFDTLLR